MNDFELIVVQLLEAICKAQERQAEALEKLSESFNFND